MSKSFHEAISKANPRLLIRQAFTSALTYSLDRMNVPAFAHFRQAFIANYHCEARVRAYDAAAQMAAQITQQGDLSVVQEALQDAGVHYMAPLPSRFQPKRSLRPATAFLGYAHGMPAETGYIQALAKRDIDLVAFDPYEPGEVTVEETFVEEVVVKVDGQVVWAMPVDELEDEIERVEAAVRCDQLEIEAQAARMVA